MPDPSIINYSADVKLWLECQPLGRLSLKRVTPDAVEFREPADDAPPGRAKLTVSIDGKSFSRIVYLAFGVTKGDTMALITPVAKNPRD